MNCFCPLITSKLTTRYFSTALSPAFLWRQCPSILSCSWMQSISSVLHSLPKRYLSFFTCIISTEEYSRHFRFHVVYIHGASGSCWSCDWKVGQSKQGHVLWECMFETWREKMALPMATKTNLMHYNTSTRMCFMQWTYFWHVMTKSCIRSLVTSILTSCLLLSIFGNYYLTDCHNTGTTVGQHKLVGGLLSWYF